MPRKPLLCLDFDGVLHLHDGVWRGAAVISGPAVEGAMEFLASAADRFDIAVHSARSGDADGVAAMREWLAGALAESLGGDAEAARVLARVSWPTSKPAARVYLDDRAMAFAGVWPSLDDIEAFEPWHLRDPQGARRSGETAMKAERRLAPAGDLRMAEAEDGEARLVRGYAALYNSASEDLGGFTEVIAPGAFRDALGGDTRALINHDANMVLGRTRSGTLRLSEDARGLAVEIDLPETQSARDLRASMARGDVNQMSFGFTVDHDTWDFRDDGTTVRTIHHVGELFDVSVVTFPAYPETEAALRSLEAARPPAPAAPAPSLTLARARLRLAGI